MPTGTSGSVLVVIVGPPSPAGTTTDVTNYGRTASGRLTESSQYILPSSYWASTRPWSAALRNQRAASKESSGTPWPTEYIRPRYIWDSAPPWLASRRYQRANSL